MLKILEGRALKFVKLGPKSIGERAEDLIRIAMYWVEEGYDGAVFDRCFCGIQCGYYSAYYIKCGHTDVEGHFIKVYNDYCKKCLSKFVAPIIS